MSPLSSADLAAIRAREQAATPGEWEIRWDSATLPENSDMPVYWPKSIGQVPDALETPPIVLFDGEDFDEPNAQFIAHSREDVPRLLSDLEALLAEPTEVQVEAVRQRILEADPTGASFSLDGCSAMARAAIKAWKESVGGK